MHNLILCNSTAIQAQCCSKALILQSCVLMQLASNITNFPDPNLRIAERPACLDVV